MTNIYVGSKYLAIEEYRMFDKAKIWRLFRIVTKNQLPLESTAEVKEFILLRLKDQTKHQEISTDNKGLILVFHLIQYHTVVSNIL